MNWTFNNNNSSSTEYKVLYLTEKEQQLHALKIAKYFLDSVATPLHPYTIWFTARCRVFANTVTTPAFISRYRNLVMSAPMVYDTEERIDDYVKKIQLELVKDKINNYPEDVEAFKMVSNKEHYDVAWQSLNTTLSAPINNLSGTMQWPARLLDEMYNGDLSYRNSLKTAWQTGYWTDEQVDEHLILTRQVVGTYGFISYGTSNISTPVNTTEDFNTFVAIMLKFSPEQFKEWYGDSPLVMKKYDILYAIIRDKLGVSL